MKFGHLIILAVTVTIGCSVLGQKSAEKPVGTHYSAAFIDSRRLIVFPFDRNDEVAIDLPTNVGAINFSTSGQTIYGIVQGSSLGPPLAAVTINPSGIRPLLGSRGFDALNSMTVDAAEDRAIISATYKHNGASDCGLFALDLAKGSVEKILDNLSGSCDYLTSWTHLSVAPDARRVVGTARKGQLGVVNLRERRIEKLWPGTAGWWSPDGKWIAALTFADPMEIELINASDFSKRRSLGRNDGLRLQWSPDSRYLLVFQMGWCGAGTGYFGTLQTLDIANGKRLPIKSSTCKVNLMTTGWVNDDVLK